ncbi:MAG: PD-(D/E)XK nuclease family protein, partial [Bacilli bacterium]
MIHQLKQTLKTNLKTLIIAPSTMHQRLYLKLHEDSPLLTNVNILSIETFIQEISQFNNQNLNQDHHIIKMLKLSNNLKKRNDPLYHNINYLNELLKLEAEFNDSFIDLIPEYNFLTSSYLKIENITCPYDQIIVLTTIDFSMGHYLLLDCFKDIVINFSNDQALNECQLVNNTKLMLYEHENNVKMMDYVIYQIYEQQDYEDTLIICDEYLLCDYIKEKLIQLNIPVVSNNHRFKQSEYLKSFFHYLNNDSNEYDLNNIKKLGYDEQLIDSLVNEHNPQQFISNLYECLSSLSYLDLNKLNQLFKPLYLLDEVNISLLLLILENKIETLFTKPQETGVVLASSDHTLNLYNNVYIVDASFDNLKAHKASYLLNTTKRNKINLVSNTFYTKQLKLKQDQLLKCAPLININYSLVSINNKANSLAFFIDNLQIPLQPLQPYYHLITQTIQANSKLNNDNVIDIQLIMQRLKNQVKISASSLDCFYNCPYQYYVRYLLKPRILQKTFSSLDLGNLYHLLLEQAGLHLLALKQDWSTTNLNQLIEYLKPILNEQLALYQKRYHLQALQIDLIAHKVISVLMINFESLSYLNHQSKYQLHSLEQHIEYPFINDLIENVVVTGKIDSIYQYQDYYSIIDYKSSAKSFNQKDFEAGISNQLIIYLNLLYHQDKQINGAFFKSLKNEYLKLDHIMNQASIKQERLSKLLLNGILLDNKYITDFDQAYLEGESPSISNIKNNTKNFNNSLYPVDKLVKSFKTLDDHIIKMITSIKA